jgi:hypothetical protein
MSRYTAATVLLVVLLERKVSVSRGKEVLTEQ